LKIYLYLFITGLALSWGPCFLFCAPIVFPYIVGTQKGWRGGLRLSLAFSAARIVSYVVLSLISAGFGQYLIRSFYETEKARIIYLATGAFICSLGIMVVLGKSLHLRFCAPFRNTEPKGIKEMALLGIMVGFAPCLPLFGVLAYIAFQAQNVLHGGLLGLTFGIGTVISPLILLGPLAGAIPAFLAKRPLIGKVLNRICGLILIYLGIEMFMRALPAICGRG